MARFRDACSVLIHRGEAPDLQVLVVHRSPALRFFGGSWALPGGVLDAGDGEPEDPEARRRCAARELFEECGVLVPGLELPAAERTELRQGLLADEPAARERWRRCLGDGRGLASLRRLGRLTTPEFAPVRYRTDFFALALPEGEQPEILPGELTAGEFARPEEVLSWFREGRRPVVPPLLFLMELLRARSVEDFAGRLAVELQRLEAGGYHPVRFAPGVFTIPLPTRTLPPATTTNCHLVGEQRLYVVDPASPDAGEQRRLADHLRAAEARGARVEGLVLSHHHPDHVGGARALAEELGRPVWAHPRTLERVDLGGSRGVPLQDGDRLELGTAPDGSPDWALEVLHTPGHAPGHLALVDTRYQSFLAGDLVSTLSSIVIDPEDGHLATYLHSLRRCLERPLGVCLPAHGPARLDSHAVLRELLEHRDQREQRVLAALAPEARGLDAIVTQAYADVPPALHGLALRSLESGLIKLEEEGRARREGDRWKRAVAVEDLR